MAKLVLCVVAALVAVAVANESTPAFQMAQFSEWMNEHGKTYETTEKWLHAFENFQASIRRIAEENAEAQGEAEFALNKFSDLSPEEFRAQYLTLKQSDIANAVEGAQQHVPTLEELNAVPLDKKDWRDAGAVTPVKDQGQCGSCWAFSVTENTESMYFLKKKQLTALAPQQLVDCDKQDSGCNGGITEWAFKYLGTAGGQMAESSYPYTSGKSGRSGPCKFDKSKIVAAVGKNGTYVGKPCMYVGEKCDNQDENLVKSALQTVGPFSVCVNAGPWQDYKSGVLKTRCPHAAENINHAVQMVGFNSDAPTPYWIIRNSWNTGWGEQGYINLAMGGNQCGVANLVLYATIQ